MRKKTDTAAMFVPEAEQPYKIPHNWRWVRLGTVCDFVGGGTPSKKNPAYWNGSIPWASVKDVKGNYLTDTIDTITEAGLQNSASNLCDVGDLILITRIEPAKTVIAKIVTAINQDLKIIKSPLSSLFLHYYFRAFQQSFLDMASGSTVLGITIPNVENAAFPLPPLAEQQRIVDRIESLFAKLDEAREKVREVIDSLFFVRQAYLYHAFMGKLTQIWRVQHQNDFPWKNETLQSVCSMKITDGTHQTPTYCKENQGIPFLSAKDITSGKICWDGIKYITPELHKELYARLAPQIDDILLAKNGTTGVAAIVDVEKVFDLYVTLALLRPNKEVILPRYLLNVVNSPICKKQFDEHLTGITLPNLHLRDIKEVTIPFPSLEEQVEIVRIVDDLTEKSQSVQAATEEVIKQIDAMKKAILGRAFRGELGTNDPSEASPDI